LDYLIEHALVEATPITQAAPELRIGPQDKLRDGAGEVVFLLKVPRQVRDYVNAVMSDAEREEVIHASMRLLFGQSWWKTIKVRRAIQEAYASSSIAGPGNEHVVIRMLLSRALERGNKKKVLQYARMAVAYCAKLLDSDRFRDALIASEAVFRVLEDAGVSDEYIEVGYYYARSMRMIGSHAQAVSIFEKLLLAPAGKVIDAFKAEIMLNLALCYKGQDRQPDALALASQIQKLVEEDSAVWLQAETIKVESTITGGAKAAKLREIEASARSKGYNVAANNIAIDLAYACEDSEDALKWLDKVLRNHDDPYNRIRAIIERASILGKEARISELSREDYKLLSAAYTYCYVQRLGSLLDKCHRVLWGMCTRDKHFAGVLRLFRFSSFIWRLRGEDSREKTYLADIAKLDLLSEGTGLEAVARVEFLYCLKRMREVVKA
jgi:tetratricopeptide (TPR) repeat protein